MDKDGPSNMSDMETTCDSTTLLRERLVANITDWSNWVIELLLEHTSLEIGCMPEYVPVDETSRAQMPSVENAMSGNCPN